VQTMSLKPQKRSCRLFRLLGVVYSDTLAHAGQGDIASMIQSGAAVQQPSGFRPTPAFTAATPTAADIACNNADRAVWTSKGQQSFISNIDACSWKCWGQATCVKSCVMQKEAYGDSCAACFGSFGQCAGDHCPFDCADAYSRKCRTCMEARCVQALTECSGFTPPEASTVVLVGGPASAFTESSSFTTPTLSEQAAAAAAAACSNGDQALWTSKGLKAFVDDMNGCTWKCWGRAACIKSCIMQKLPYSDSCATCFGTFGKCSKDNCRFACSRNPRSQWCKNCIKPHCFPAFAECTGLH